MTRQRGVALRERPRRPRCSKTCITAGGDPSGTQRRGGAFTVASASELAAASASGVMYGLHYEFYGLCPSYYGGGLDLKTQKFVRP